MGASNYRQLWSHLKKATYDREAGSRLARQIAAAFLDGFLKDGSYGEDHITLLCEMSTQGQDRLLSQSAARALFGMIIERLCDEFEELPADTYNRVMAQVLTFCRQLPAGAELDRQLAVAGIHSRKEILRRIDLIRAREIRLPTQRPPQKIFVLSRVTIGADVAVTSIVLQRLADFFPQAELILLGSAKCAQIFGGFKRLSMVPMTYPKNGGLFERLDGWHQARQIISGRSRAGAGDRAILIDPDSRLSQLGLLPLVPDERYFYFNSRSSDGAKNRLSIGALANSWLDRICDRICFTHPGVWPRPDNLLKAAAFCERLRSSGARRLIVVNFGVGGNPRKKIGRQFEHDLLLRLLGEAGTVILLDKGFGEAEAGSADRLMGALRARGHQAQPIDLNDRRQAPIDSGVLGLQLQIGELAALIKNSDEYIGYDSAGQHMAAALKVPCTTVFAGSNSMRFIQRWAALGPAERHIVHADTLTDPAAIDVADVIERVMAARGRA